MQPHVIDGVEKSECDPLRPFTPSTRLSKSPFFQRTDFQNEERTASSQSARPGVYRSMNVLSKLQVRALFPARPVNFRSWNSQHSPLFLREFFGEFIPEQFTPTAVLNQ